MPKIRVILDTNWYISAIVNKKSRRKVYGILANRNLVVLYSEELLSEFGSVVQRDKFKNLVTREQVNRFLVLALGEMKRVKIKNRVTKSRDPKDNYLLAMALDGKADYIVTGDVHLLELTAIANTKIVTLSQFESVLASNPK